MQSRVYRRDSEQNVHGNERVLCAFDAELVRSRGERRGFRAIFHRNHRHRLRDMT